ncbi:hypothetical protein LEMLEM_LOCUS23395 [Lemmus lemmus]
MRPGRPARDLREERESASRVETELRGKFPEGREHPSIIGKMQGCERSLGSGGVEENRRTLEENYH